MPGAIQKYPKLIFLVEENNLYARMLETYLKMKFPIATEIRIFPLGDLSEEDLNLLPDVVIMDFANTVLHDERAEMFQVIRTIRNREPQPHVIIVSPSRNVSNVLQYIEDRGCSYVPRNEHAFQNIDSIIRSRYVG